LDGGEILSDGQRHDDHASTPPSGEAEGERVRFCLACGAVTAFGEPVCPECGHDERPAAAFAPSPDAPEQTDRTAPGAPDATRGDDPGERVRFCLACGAVVGFGEPVCPECGHDERREGVASPGSGERVRFCMNCGEIVRFDQRTCPQCGHYEPATPLAPAQRVVPCAACGGSIPEDTLFCPACGAEPGYEPPPDDVAVAPPDGERWHADEVFGLAVAMLAPALVLAAALVALVVAR